MGLGRRQHMPPLTIFSQNCRGLKTDGRIDELVHVLQERRAFLACVQETWRYGKDDVVCNGWTFLGIGPEQQRGRGSQGVGILLSPRAATALRLGGTEVYYESPRVMAVRLLVQDGRSRRQLGAFVLNSYAPVSTSPEEERDAYYAAIDSVLSYKRPGDVLVWCCDANASMGTNQGCRPAHTGAVGGFGLAHTNASGRRLRTYLELQQFTSLSTHFRKRFYGTWSHPRSRLPHQIDHVITACEDRKRFLDAGSFAGQLIDSDHRGMVCQLRVAVRMGNRPTSRQRMTSADFAPLRGNDANAARAVFADAVVRNVTASTASQPSGHTQIDPERPSLPLVSDGAAAAAVQPAVDGDGSVRQSSSPAAVPYSTLAAAVEQTILEQLPRRQRSTPGWFAFSADELHARIAERNAAFDARQQQPSASDARSRL